MPFRRWRRALLDQIASRKRADEPQPVPPLEPEEAHIVRVERALIAVRWLAVLVVLIAAPFARFSPGELAGIYAVAGLGGVYTLFLQVVVVKRHVAWLSGGYLTAAADAALVSLVVFVSGGGSSTFALAYFLEVVAVAVRFGERASLIAAILSLGLYIAVAAAHPAGLPPPGEIALRFCFLALTGLLAGYLAREARNSQLALAAELSRTKQLHRESVALAKENAELSGRLGQRLAELESTQAQLVRSTKLAAIGELAANIAHEINNPLTGVLSLVELLQEESAEHSSHRADLDTIRDETLRVRAIVRSLLDFARQTPPQLELTDPRPVLASILPLVRKRAAVAGVDIHQAHAPEPLPIVVDVSQLKQVLINLLTNAIDAMPDGGAIFVGTERQDDEVVITVRDTGPGIPAEHIERIFEPFFTTKSTVSGTGLGLSVSLGIIERHGGTIAAKSEPGAGATFTVRLPAGARPTREPDGERQRPLVVGRGG
jgi:signal transduction histidine kinase